MDQSVGPKIQKFFFAVFDPRNVVLECGMWPKKGQKWHNYYTQVDELKIPMPQ